MKRSVILHPFASTECNCDANLDSPKNAGFSGSEFQICNKVAYTCCNTLWESNVGSTVARCVSEGCVNETISAH